MGNSTISTTEARWVGSAVDWSQVDRENYLLAMERNPVRDVEIKTLLKSTPADAADDRDAFMKGIDASYASGGMLPIPRRSWDADPERDAGSGAARW